MPNNKYITVDQTTNIMNTFTNKADSRFKLNILTGTLALTDGNNSAWTPVYDQQDPTKLLFYTQTITVTGLSKDDIVTVGFDISQMAIADIPVVAKSQIYCVGQDDDELDFMAYKLPTCDIPIILTKQGGITTIVNIPTVTIGEHTYDGTEQSVTISSYDPNEITVTGNTGTNIGNYECILTLKPNMIWSDGTVAPKRYPWSIKPEIVSFSEGTDAQIKAMLDAYYDDDLTWTEMGWAIGDTRTIHLNSRSAPNPNSGTTLGAEDITVVIVGHDHHDLATPINGHTKACISVQFREALGSTSYNGTDGTIYVNGDSSYDMSFTKWSNLYMRTYLNGTLLGAIPTGDFKSAIKQSKHYRHTNYNDANAEQVTDTLFLPSYAEIFGTESCTYYTPTSPTEGTQLPYYETASNRIKYANNNGESSGNAIYWWNGSTSSYYSSSRGYYWCYVYTDGSATHHRGISAAGVAPAFAM